MSKEIQVPVSDLKSISQKIAESVDDNKDLFDQIEKIMQQMESSGEWKGQSMKSAMNAVRSNNKKYQKLMESLSALAKFMDQFAEDMVTEDDRIQGKIAGVKA